MSVEMVHVYRGKYIESIHRGDLVVVDYKGNIIYEAGDAGKETFWRSSAKPFQTLPLIEAGGIEQYGLSQKEIALMTSSHGGEEKHVEILQSIFKKTGLEKETLDCGIAAPMHQKTAMEMARRNIPYTSMNNSCSGKHSCILLICKLKGYNEENYIQLQHPVQQEMLQVISDMTNLSKENIKIAVDGCGVPVFGMPIYNMALAYASLAEPTLIKGENRRKALKVISNAMTENPFFVAGTGHLDTILMEVTKGRILAKHGAESVYCVSLMDKGIGIALKIEDGAYRGVGPVIIKTLRKLGCLRDEEFEALKEQSEVQIKNHRGEVVGSIKAVL